MALPDVDFSKIRPLGESQDKAFEELCCQLASLESRPAGSTFHRKGAGADAGVECFTRTVDGRETGWQVKYHQKFGNDLLKSLGDSLKTALLKHPRLEKYVVCIRIDLSDARTGKGSSPLKQWEDWKGEQETQQTAAGRSLVIELWDAHAIRERLGRDGPMYAGRILYWFGAEALTPNWFKQRLAKATASLGPRYTAETSIKLPIRRKLLVVARDPTINRTIVSWHDQLAEKGGRVTHTLGRDQTITWDGAVDFRSSLGNLLGSLGGGPWSPDIPLPIPQWIKEMARLSELASSLYHWCWEQPAETGGTTNRSDNLKRAVGDFSSTLDDILAEAESVEWQLANANAVLVYGDAGQGKSHLLADVVTHHVDRGRPAILLLGSKFGDNDPWRQIIHELDLPPSTQTKHLLGALDAAAEAAGTRALLVIDALNERNGMAIWPYHLAGMLSEVAPFKRIVTILSCRSTFLSQVIPEALGEDQLPRIEHAGFRSGDATAYLRARGFVLPGMPNPVLELRNPLFLKCCCDALERMSLRKFPKGLSGTTQVFNFYTRAVADSINKRIGLNPDRKIVEKAIAALAGEVAKSGYGIVSYDRAAEVIDALYPTGSASIQNDLLFQLEAEGVISVDLAFDDVTERRDVRFSFERYSDHVTARRLLDDHLEEANSLGAFPSEKPLADLLEREDTLRLAGVIEAIAIQLPERAGVELPDATKGERASWIIFEAFKKSLLEREPACFSERTMTIVREIGGADLECEVLLSLATEPRCRFNALHLHDRLMRIPMPERDATWSTWLATADLDGGALSTLLDWALECGFSSIEEKRAELACVALSWLLSTSSRQVRDRATKALVSMLAPRLSLVPYLLERFAAVDDLYIQERLFCACYGAALQGLADDKTISVIAHEVYRRLFTNGTPPVNVLIRDHGRGIIEYAVWRRCLPSDVDLKLCRPPYSSPWPVEQVPDEVIEGYKRTYASGYRGADEIVGSCVNDGDFARYVIDGHVRVWSPAPIGTNPLPADKDLAVAWRKQFLVDATPQARAALLSLDRATEADGQARSADSSERRAYVEALSQFRQAITPEQWEVYRTQAQGWWSQGMFQHWPGTNRPACFNLAWARRWICKRAHDFGWSETLHGKFDREGHSYGRMDHFVERIGKKYQWLALYELRARMADNLAYIGGDGDRYHGEWQGSLRDVDPSLLVGKSEIDDEEQASAPTWWSPFALNLRPIAPEKRLMWRDSPDDRIDGPELIELMESSTGQRWLALYTFYSFDQWAVHDGDRQLERDTWSRLTCVVVPKAREESFLGKLKGRSLIDLHALPRPEFFSSKTYLGEYPWHPSCDIGTETLSADEKIQHDQSCWQPTTVEYTCERGGYDYSIQETIRRQLPAPWLIAELDLKLQSGRRPTFVNASGRAIFIDPSADAPGPSTAVIDREVFLGLLDQLDLTAIWVVAGEKGVYGGGAASKGFGGRQVFTSLYRLVDGVLTKETYLETNLPTREQVGALFDDECPEWAMKLALRCAPS